MLAKIDSVAEISDRSRSWIIIRALRTYLVGEGSEILEVLGGREDIAAGRSISLDEFLGQLEDTASKNAA